MAEYRWTWWDMDRTDWEQMQIARMTRNRWI